MIVTDAMLLWYEYVVFGILAVWALVFLITLTISMINNQDKIKFYSFMVRNDGRISKLSLTFIFTLPVILFQAVTTNHITNGLMEIMFAVFAADLGVKGIQKWNGKGKNKNNEIEDDIPLMSPRGKTDDIE